MFAPPRTPPRRPVVALFIAGIVTIPLPACTSSAATEPDGGSPSIEVNPKIELSYKPTGLPIHIIVDSNGNIEVTSDPFVTVPIPFLGTVSAGIALEPNTNTNNTENGLLTIRLNGQDHLYDIGKEDVNILFEEGYFSQTRVITRGQDVLIVLERSVTPRSPADDVHYYWNSVGAQRFQAAWPYLSQSFRNAQNPDGYGDYENAWRHVDAQILDIATLSQTGDYASVQATVRFFMPGGRIVDDRMIHDLVLDSDSGHWLIDHVDVTTVSDTAASQPSPEGMVEPTSDDVNFTPIVELTADTNSLIAGDCTFLRWRIEHIDRAYLQDEAITGPTGSLEVCPVESTQFVLEAVLPDGSEVLRDVRLLVDEPPVPQIDFWADATEIDPESCTTIRWSVTDIDSVYFDGEGVAGDGARDVCPDHSTAYTLQVRMRDGSETTQTVTIMVRQPQVVEPSPTDIPQSGIDPYP